MAGVSNIRMMSKSKMRSKRRIGCFVS